MLSLPLLRVDTNSDSNGPSPSISCCCGNWIACLLLLVRFLFLPAPSFSSPPPSFSPPTSSLRPLKLTLTRLFLGSRRRMCALTQVPAGNSFAGSATNLPAMSSEIWHSALTTALRWTNLTKTPNDSEPSTMPRIRCPTRNPFRTLRSISALALSRLEEEDDSALPPAAAAFFAFSFSFRCASLSFSILSLFFCRFSRLRRVRFILRLKSWTNFLMVLELRRRKDS
mmetsp:Transcript_9021/g.14366  ORF Transcript_9021/g.14366 Transcript_9021/m.14366 type:complete len:226 (+) Transcript_9021:623-1300(+)